MDQISEIIASALITFKPGDKVTESNIKDVPVGTLVEWSGVGYRFGAVKEADNEWMTQGSRIPLNDEEIWDESSDPAYVATVGDKYSASQRLRQVMAILTRAQNEVESPEFRALCVEASLKILSEGPV